MTLVIVLVGLPELFFFIIREVHWVGGSTGGNDYNLKTKKSLIKKPGIESVA